MKILHIIPSYLPAVRASGPIIPTHVLNRELARGGNSVSVYTTNYDEREPMDVPLRRPVFLDGVEVTYFPKEFPKRWGYSPDMVTALKRTVRDFDVVHITSVFLAASTLGAHYARVSGRPYIISPHGSLMKEPLSMKSPLKKKVYLSLIEDRNLGRAAAIHFTIEKEMEEYRAQGLPLRKGIVIPNALERGGASRRSVDMRGKLGIPGEKKIVLHLGRINWKKGFDTLIPAFAAVLRSVPEAILVIAGGDDEGYARSIKVQISDLKMERSVVFAGMLLGEEKDAMFRQSDAFTLPSYSENFGMTVVEAMDAELPVIVSENVGIAPEIKAMNAGIIIRKDVDELAGALVRVLRDDGRLRSSLVANGRRFVDLYCDPKAVADRFLDAYRSVAGMVQ